MLQQMIETRDAYGKYPEDICRVDVLLQKDYNLLPNGGQSANKQKKFIPNT
jgi:hypothetical protein